MNILLGMTGSVAAVLGPKLIEALKPLGTVRVIVTDKVEYFLHLWELQQAIDPSDGKFERLEDVFQDEDEWTTHYQKDKPILHIELRKWADVMVIAPLSANTLAKIANGLCDNLLTSVVRAWDYNKPLVIAPAMNTFMWDNPITKKHLHAISAHVVQPQEKTLACGDTGIGAMGDISKIIEITKRSLLWNWPFHYPCCNGIPIKGHPGSFGFARKHDVHTGVDLYTSPGTWFMAMEYGTVIKIIPFTGEVAGFPWWLNTSAILVKGASGVICYGEVEANTDLKEGDVVKKGQNIGRVIPVLREGKERPDIQGHSRAMLHIELYTELYDNLTRGVWEGWQLGAVKPEKLLDPTPKLIDAKPMWVEFLK